MILLQTGDRKKWCEHVCLGEAPGSFPTCVIERADDRCRAIAFENSEPLTSHRRVYISPAQLGQLHVFLLAKSSVFPLLLALPFPLPGPWHWYISLPKCPQALPEVVNNMSSHPCWCQHIYNVKSPLDAMIGSNNDSKTRKRTVRVGTA